MKKTIYLITFLTVLFYSCKKELRMSLEAPNATLLDKTKQFYDKQTTILSVKANQLSSIDGATGAKSKEKAKFPPLWENAQTGATANGKHIISVPLAVYQLDVKDVNYTRKVVFTENGGEVTAGKITEVFASPEMIAAHGDELANGQVSPESIGFTGSIVNYNLEYKEAKGKYYKNGVAAKGEVSISEKPAAMSVKLQQTKDGSSTNKAKVSAISGNDRTISAIDPVFDDGENCDNVYEVYMEKDASGNVTYWEIIRFLYRICNGGPVVGAPPGGRDVYVDCFRVVNGEAYDSDCGCIGGTTGIEVCVPEIKDQLDDYPCAKSLVTTMTSLKSDIANKINAMFGKSTSLNITFGVNPNLPANVDGRLGVPTGIPQRNIITYNIGLNATTLANASKEYILVTLYHEAMHAYLAHRKHELGDVEFAKQFEGFEVNGGRLIEMMDIQHSSLAYQNYITGLAGVIMAFNNSYSSERAMALAKLGIVKVNAAEKAINEQERDTRVPGYTGTKCP